MANYREHVTVSSLLGLGYGVGASIAFGYTPIQGILAGCLTAVGGMLPDLDSPRARPVQELFGVVAAVGPLLLVNRLVKWLGIPSDPETIMALVGCLYFAVKYGGAMLVDLLSVHRGMFHSIPAMLITGEGVYLVYPHHHVPVKLLMAGGIALGFLSHLLLDELYSVHMQDARLRLKKSSGTALKLSGDKFLPNVAAYTILATLTAAVMQDSGFLEQQRQRGQVPFGASSQPIAPAGPSSSLQSPIEALASPPEAETAALPPAFPPSIR